MIPTVEQVLLLTASLLGDPSQRKFTNAKLQPFFELAYEELTGETRSVSRERSPGAEGVVGDFGSPLAGETRYDRKRSFIEVVRVDPGNTHLPGGNADFELDHHLCEFATIDQHDSLNRTSKLDGLGSER